MYELVLKTQFSAAHQLKHYRGKCENLHGHTWEVEVILVKSNLNHQGMALDFKVAHRIIEKVVKRFDHKYLNKLKPLNKDNPTTEHLARLIYQQLEKPFVKRGITLKKVGIWESPYSGAYYSPIETPINREEKYAV